MKKTMTKIAIAAAMILPAQFAFSQSSPYGFSLSNPHDGLYMGVEGSYAKTKNNSLEVIEPEYDGVVLTEDIRQTSFRDPKFADEGAGAGLFFGYRISEGKFTIATEATYGHSFISNNNNLSDSFELSSEFGITILPGVWLNDNVVLQVHLGASQLRIKSRAGTEVFDTTDTGFSFGAGIQIYANEQLSFRASFTRSTHNHKTGEWIDVYEITDGGLELTDTAFFEYDSTLRRNKFAASIVYNF